MRWTKINFGTSGNNACRVDGPMTSKIVILDMVHVHRLRYTRHLIQIPCISPQIGIVYQAFFVGFEMVIVHRIKANKRREQTPVRLRDLIADQVALRSQPS